MAKALNFHFEDRQVSFQMVKVDRSKLYGFKEAEVLDEQDQKCELATLAEDGRTVIGRGGTGIGYLTADGEWSDKTDLTPVDLDGEPMTPVPSSFSAPIELAQTASFEDFLDHNIRLVYKLEPSAGTEQLFEQLKSGTIFKFPYSYRGGLEPDVGFLLLNDANEIFFLIGDQTAINFVDLKPVILSEEPAPDDEDSMDFGMI